MLSSGSDRWSLGQHEMMLLLGSLVGGKEKSEMVQADLVSDLCPFTTLVPER